MPQGMVDKNLGLDRLAGPKAVKSQHLQTTNPFNALPLSEILAAHGNEICLFRAKAFLSTHTINVLRFT